MTDNLKLPCKGVDSGIIIVISMKDVGGEEACMEVLNEIYLVKFNRLRPVPKHCLC